MEPRGSDGGSGSPLAGPLTRLAFESGAFVVCTWKSVAIVCWPDRPTGPSVQRVGEVTAPLVAAFPGKISVVNVIERGVRLPTPEGRAGLIALMDRYGGNTACAAVILLGVGFWASAFQGVITGMHMLSPRSFSLRVESRVETAAEWLALEHRRRTGATLDPKELASAVNAARSFNGSTAAGP
jgi:hypothetical protein